MMEKQTEQKERYKELRPANIYDVVATETWLEDMAKQGYRLTGMTNWSGVFEKDGALSLPLPDAALAEKGKGTGGGDD